MQLVNIIGGGLAGCEAAYQLLKRGYSVNLYEMRAVKMTPAHHTQSLAELVCSNSLKSLENSTASGTLKVELSLLDSLLLRCAQKAKVPAGSALAVNRDDFSKEVENELNQFPNFTRVDAEIEFINTDIPTIVASGPLTSDKLAFNIANLVGNEGGLYFYDAAAPIIDGNSIDYKTAFYATRYDKGEPSDYLNCGMDKEQYNIFYQELINAQSAKLHEFETTSVFEGCMPIEIMAKRGAETIRYGMMKPIGIINPNNNKRYFAVVQLRKENTEGSAFNLVGFQTNLTFQEQKRVFRMIPGLENAEFLRYGVMHRNTFLNSPKVLDSTFKLIGSKFTYFAGQITGVEGYVESIMSGLTSAINLDRKLSNKDIFLPPQTTITGSLMRYVSTENLNFQPMNANFGILPELNEIYRDKKLRKLAYFERANNDMITYLKGE